MLFGRAHCHQARYPAAEGLGRGRPQVLGRAGHFWLQWILQNQSTFRERLQKWWTAWEHCPVQGEGKLRASFWSLLPRKSSSPLQAPVILATPLIPSRTVTIVYYCLRFLICCCIVPTSAVEHTEIFHDLWCARVHFWQLILNLTAQWLVIAGCWIRQLQPSLLASSSSEQENW